MNVFNLRFSLVGGTLACLSSFSCAAPPTVSIHKVVAPQSQMAKSYLRGVNIMDLGIAGEVLPGIYGRNYTTPSLQALQALKGRGLDVVRIPFKWERIQPRLNGELDAAYLGYLLQVLRDAHTAKLQVIVDMHNYGRYTPTVTDDRTTYPFGDPQGPTEAQYADAWKKIAAAIKADAQAYSAVYAYDLMNEPYGLPAVKGELENLHSISTFENGTAGWTVNAPLAVSTSKRDGKSALAVTAPATEGSGKVYTVLLPVAAQMVSAANGTTIQVKGFVPATTPGVVRMRMLLIDSNWKPLKTEIVPVEKGKPFTLNFSQEAALWKDNRGIAFDFIVDKSDGSAPMIFQIDSVVQGMPGTEKKPAQVWEGYAQAAVSGLRAAKDSTLIMVEGYDFSSSGMWPTNHPTAWIKDPLNKVMYHAHLYMDKDSSGTYKSSHTDELNWAKEQGYASVGARTIAHVKNFTDWVGAQKTKGFIGEFGWPNSDVVGKADSDAWDKDAEEVFTFLDGTKTGLTVWSTGSWLDAKGNILNTYILPGLPSHTFTPLSPAFVLERHPGK